MDIEVQEGQKEKLVQLETKDQKESLARSDPEESMEN